MIVFSHPSKRSGGVEYLIINLCEYINKYNDEEGALIDNSSGFIKTKLEREKIDYIFFDINNLSFCKSIFSNKEVYIIFHNFYNTINELKGTDIRILYWQVFTTTLIYIFSYIKVNGKRVYLQNPFAVFFARDLKKRLIERNAYYVMDTSHYEVLSYKGVNIQ